MTQLALDRKPLRLLMVEDSEEDARLLHAELAEANAELVFKRVDCANDMRAVLDDSEWDIVISDHSMPRFSSLDALSLLKESGKDIPFIIYSGDVSQHVEVAALSGGAQDSIPKGNVARLVPAIERELHGAALRRAKAEVDARVHKLAFYDSLTGLPNRNLFCDYVGRKLALAEGPSPAVLMLDVDRLLRINNRFGYEVGDALIGQIGQRLRDCVREEGTLARLGGDDFAVFLDNIATSAQARDAAERIRGAFARPFTLAGLELCVSASIGMSVFPDGGKDVAELLINAEAAKFRAKSLGGRHCQLYVPAMRAVSDDQWLLESALRGAVERGELLLEYQPLIDIGSGRLAGVEALVRWRHPQFGMLAPDKFIPLANESGLIVEIGKWVLQRACRQARLWHDAGHRGLAVAVNVSPVQFWQPGLVQFVGDVLTDTGIEPRCLELEITESVLMRDAEDTIRTLQALKKMHVSISVDDFGTGYSSLSYLKRFPIDILKIDRVFSSDVMHNPASAAIVQAIGSLARSLRLGTVAEGIETREQLEFFRTERCERAQGLLFSAPRAEQEITAMLACG